MKTQKRVSEFFETYTRDLKADDLQRLFTRDTREAYDFFTRNTDLAAAKSLPWHKRIAHQTKLIYMAFAMRMSPARRVVHGVAVLAALFGLLRLSRYGFPDGTGWLLIAFGLANLLIVLEVADRLSLKNDLEVAREIQLAMLPRGVGRTAAVETAGVSRPANTVGGDFYDVIPLGDGRLVVALGDVAGKGSPAALLMALLMAMLRTLVHSWEGESRDTADLMARLNVQVARHAPGSRFITLFCAVYDPATHELEYVNAGHMPPILMRVDGTTERLTRGGIALGMFDASTYQSGRVAIAAGDLLTMYSDGITEAEDPQGRPLDDQGLETILQVEHERDLADITAAVLHAVEVHTADTRFADDLTILLMRRTVAA